MASPTPGLTRRYSTVIGLTGLIGALVVAVVLDNAIAAGMSYHPDPAFNRPIVLGWRLSRVIAIVVSVICLVVYMRHQAYKMFTAEVADELIKSHWPNREETQSDSIVVIIVSFILGGILFVFDVLSGHATTFIYDLVP